ncbi:MAG: hypothetical protein HXS52_11950 [Theionarchaea archaeon]|nr:hypothetical protein [Theionarchaea archaeon]MBU7038634.1 hypothetical protein [Theionarchaea archaeon]
MVKSKTILIIVGIIVLLMGILGLLDLDYATEPSWHAVLKIIVGLVAVVFGYMDKT